MDTEGTVRTHEEARLPEEAWADAEWFQEWLRLARRDYQGKPQTAPEFRRAGSLSIDITR